MFQTKIQKNINRSRWYLVPLIFAFGLVVVASLNFPSPAKAAIPAYINFQGRMTNASDGSNVANGNYSMQFKIYSALSGGTLLWTETWDGTAGTTQVAVTNGVFNVALGTYISLSNIDFTTGNLFLSVNFNSGSGYDGEMAPRKQLTSSAFAFNSNSLVGSGNINITIQETGQHTSSLATPATGPQHPWVTLRRAPRHSQLRPPLLLPFLPCLTPTLVPQRPKIQPKITQK